MGVTVGMASVRKYQRLRPSQTEPVPAGFKMDPLQDTSEPLTHGVGRVPRGKCI